MIPPSNQKIRSAFTLIELLVVIAIIIVLASFLAPAFNGIMRAGGVTGAMDDVSGIINIARTEAMGKNTYVWLGFYNGTSNGNAQLWVTAERSIDGTPTLTGTNAQPLGKLLKLDNIQLTNQAGLVSNIQTLLSTAGVNSTNAPAVLDSLATVSPTFSLAVNGSTTQFAQFIVFTPQGQALLATNPSNATPPYPFTNQIMIGLCKTAGTTNLKGNGDSVALVLNGGTGSVQIFRP